MNNKQLKKCTSCEKKGQPCWHPISEFSRDRTKKDGVSSMCKTCKNEYQAEYQRKKSQQKERAVKSEVQVQYHTNGHAPLSQRTVNFYGDELIAVQQDGKVYSPVKYMCECLGVSWNGQRERIERDAVLSSTARVIRVVAHDGKEREALCLPVEYIHGWLFGIDENRVKPEIRDKLITYKEECYNALATVFGASNGSGLSEQLLLNMMTALEQRMMQEMEHRLSSMLQNYAVSTEVRINLPGCFYIARLDTKWIEADPENYKAQVEECIPGFSERYDRGYDVICIGCHNEPTPDNRIKRHAGKIGTIVGQFTKLVGYITTDEPHMVERLMRNNPHEKAIRASAGKDWFYLPKGIIDDICKTWPQSATFNEIQENIFLWEHRAPCFVVREF